jgi:hypothetical protein
VIGAVALLFGILSWAAAIRAATSQTEDAWMVTASAVLAARVRRQWQAEQHLRRIEGADLLQIHWSSTTGQLAASPADVLAGGVGGRPTRLRIGGVINDVGTAFRRLPRGRLVVLGQPGAGKTVLAVTLTLQLLEGRGPDDPVPVLLLLSTWDPREDIESWLLRRLSDEYPGVTPMPNGTAKGYQDLLQSGRIVPILDGLDELPSALRVQGSVPLISSRLKATRS